MILGIWAKKNWNEKLGIPAMAKDFDIGLEQLDGCELLLAYYDIDGYEGEAFVLFRKDGKLYEVNGAHCSCYGLEGEWKPEETTKEELLYRIAKGSLGRGTFADELSGILNGID